MRRFCALYKVNSTAARVRYYAMRDADSGSNLGVVQAWPSDSQSWVSRGWRHVLSRWQASSVSSGTSTLLATTECPWSSRHASTMTDSGENSMWSKWTASGSFSTDFNLGCTYITHCSCWLFIVKYCRRLLNSAKTTWQYLILHNTSEKTSYIHKAKLGSWENKVQQQSCIAFVQIEEAVST